MPLQVEVVGPEEIKFSGEADMVICRTTNGDIAFLPGHAPFLGALGEGAVRIVSGHEEQHAEVSGGFVDVRDDRVTILSS